MADLQTNSFSMLNLYSYHHKANKIIGTSHKLNLQQVFQIIKLLINNLEGNDIAKTDRREKIFNRSGVLGVLNVISHIKIYKRKKCNENLLPINRTDICS